MNILPADAKMMRNCSYNEASSTSGSVSPIANDAEEPRKKGARGGKRSVAHLSKAQLARKRANDREAQRNIRLRTKEHIEALEKKVKQLEECRREGSVERIIKRNQELEAEVEKLRAQMSLDGVSQPLSTPNQEPHDDLLMSQKPPLGWISEPPTNTHNIWTNHVSSVEVLEENHLDQQYTTGQPVYPVPHSMGYVSEHSPHGVQSPLNLLSWEEEPSMVNKNKHSNPPTTSDDPAALQPWAPLQEQSRFPHMGRSGFTEMLNTPTQFMGTCWQNQPSTYAWQICTKLSAPVSILDQLMFSIIHSQRHLAITGSSTTSEITSSNAVGTSFPSVHIIFDQPGPAYKPSNLEETMSRYASLLTKRGFSSTIPERLASFMCMYRFIQWQICPSHTTYSSLHEWQAPRPSQLVIPHPSWMDLPPWGKFRDRIIKDQERYNNMEFQNTYARNLCVNWPHDDMNALVFEDGAIRISEEMDKHLSDIGNISMKKEFADKYPEFRDACRFDEE